MCILSHNSLLLVLKTLQQFAANGEAAKKHTEQPIII